MNNVVSYLMGSCRIASTNHKREIGWSYKDLTKELVCLLKAAHVCVAGLEGRLAFLVPSTWTF